jgi:biopolymer transport protein ExbD
MRKSIRFRRGRKKLNKDFELNLTSLMDILIIILVFLLKSYSASTNSFTTVPGMQIPQSKSQEIPLDALSIIVTQKEIVFENTNIVELGKDDVPGVNPKDLDEGGRTIAPLFEVLTKAREKAEFLRAKSSARDAQGEPLAFDGVLAIQADKQVSYSVLRKVMYTAGAAGYKSFRMLALRVDQ